MVYCSCRRNWSAFKADSVSLRDGDCSSVGGTPGCGPGGRGSGVPSVTPFCASCVSGRKLRTWPVWSRSGFLFIMAGNRASARGGECRLAPLDTLPACDQPVSSAFCYGVAPPSPLLPRGARDARRFVCRVTRLRWHESCERVIVASIQKYSPCDEWEGAMELRLRYSALSKKEAPALTIIRSGGGARHTNNNERTTL